jgi:uncharacterized membrane protein
MTQTPSIPPLIESEESNYRDSGVPSTVAIAGHPIHPVIVTLPIAFLVAAALTGLMDFIKIGRVRKHTAGWAHMYINVTALVLTAINLGLRLANPADNILFTGLIVSVIIAALLGASGWYGGELVYRHKIAVIGYGNQEQR